MSKERSVFTIAVGKPIYLTMAFALARSFLRHNKGSDIGFTLVTDRSVAARPSDLEAIEWTQIAEGAYGSGFAPKLYLDHFAPAVRSMFIDADCLCVGSLKPAFRSFEGRCVAVVGRPLRTGEWFGDVDLILRKLELKSMPRFNGGVYYLESGNTCSAVYETARSLLPQYDELGFTRLRGRENDEVLMSAAMAIHGQEAIPEDGLIMHTALEAPGGVHLDVISGRSLLLNPKDHPQHFGWMPLEIMRPAIVHFLGSNLDEHPYRTEVEALKCLAAGWPPRLARLYANVCYGAPLLAAKRSKRMLRPLYRALFGFRPIRSGLR